MAAVDVLDNKVVKCPVAWDGDKAKWKHWNVKLCGYIGGVSRTLAEMMEGAGEKNDAVSASIGGKAPQGAGGGREARLKPRARETPMTSGADAKGNLPKFAGPSAHGVSDLSPLSVVFTVLQPRARGAPGALDPQSHHFGDLSATKSRFLAIFGRVDLRGAVQPLQTAYCS